MNGLLAIILCALASVEATVDSIDSSLDTIDSEGTTRDVYGSWTLGEVEVSESEDESSVSTNSLFQKHYWVTHYWRTPEWESNSEDQSTKPPYRMVGRYSYRGNNSRNFTRRIRRNRTTRIVTGRWPKFRRIGYRHSVRPGFGRPKKNTTIGLITPGEKNCTAHRTNFVKTFAGGRVSPYSHLRATYDKDSSLWALTKVIRPRRTRLGAPTNVTRPRRTRLDVLKNLIRPRRTRCTLRTARRMYFVKTFTTFAGSQRRRILRKHYTYRSRVSPYFHWHTLHNENSSLPRMKILRGSRRAYGTRVPPRPNRFKWVSRLHRTKMYVGNLTCRLFIMRNRTSMLLISPRQNGTTPSLESSESAEYTPTPTAAPFSGRSPIGTDVFDPSSRATENERPSSVFNNYTISYHTTQVYDSTMSAFNYTSDDDPTFHTLSRQIDSTISMPNSTTKKAIFTQTNESSPSTSSKYTIESEFPDISYKLRYSPKPDHRH